MSNPAVAARLVRRHGDYGFDAPTVPIILGAVSIVALVLAALSLWVWQAPGWAIYCLIVGIFMALSAACYIYTTRAGKFHVWAGLLANLDLRGDEQVADLGCGRGAVLLMAAALVPRGKAVGVDLWQTHDQSGNALETTRHNAELEGVAERVELLTGDLRELPLPDAAFDVVLSSAAIHNIHGTGERERAVAESVRILKPGGRMLIADINATSIYARELARLGMADVRQRGLGWRFWYGGPWVAARLVSARKPA